MQAKAIQLVRNPIMIIVFITVLILGGVYFTGKNAGKNTVNQAPKPKKLPNSGSDIPKGWSPDSLVASLHDAMSGWFTLDTTKSEQFEVALSLTDGQLTAVYNRFNDLHYPTSKQTLYAWVDGEYLWYNSQNRLLDRMKKLGLT